MNYEQILEKLVSEDERFIIMTAENRAAIRNLPSKIGNRFIDVGIAEQTMIGSAAGFALRGRIPVTHALSTFLTLRAFEFIRTDVGIANLPVKMIGGVPGFLSEANGPTHQALEDIALMRGIPHIGVFCPADIEDLEIGIEQILCSEQPFYVRYTNISPSVTHSREFTIGKAEIISTGSDVTILTYGLLLREAMSAASILNENNISTGVVNLRTLKPIDKEVLTRSLTDSHCVVTLEDHFKIGGLYSIVAEHCLENRIAANVLPIALDNKWFAPSLLPEVLENEGFTGIQIAQTIQQHLLH